MDSDHLFASSSNINWGFTEETPGHESTPNPLHAVFGQSATSSQQRQVPGQVLNPIDDAQMHQVRNNNPNITQSQENHSSSDNVAERSAPKATKRSKFGKLDWDYHKEKIRILYLEENKSLAETMELMRQRHGFDASTKLYKDQFKSWHWQKNLSARHSRFMAEKVKERRGEEKDTVFLYGGQTWTSDKVTSIDGRAKRQRFDGGIMDIDTPASVSYKTPKGYVVEESSSDSSSVEEAIQDDEHDDPTLLLSWNGHTRTSLLAMWNLARSNVSERPFDQTEDLLKQVWEGFSHVVGVTSDDTNKVGYALAELYAENHEMQHADRIIEEMTQKHITILGYDDRRTQQHVLHCIELLNAWNRPDDALGFLSRSKELLETKSTQETPNARGKRRRRRAKGKGAEQHSQEASTSLANISRSITDNDDPLMIDHALEVANTHVAAKDQSVEHLLLQIISCCKSDTRRFPIQYVKATSELLRLYVKLGTVHDHKEMFLSARNVFDQVEFDYDWYEERYECIEVMEALLQLAADVLRGHFDIMARYMFRKVVDQAIPLFGYNDERTVWIQITVGIAYQSLTTWGQAWEWFEEAYSGALANPKWGEKDGIVRSLRNALDKHHFSYLSDEGRPFKTIFGVSGITIRPGRLHLE